MVGLDPERGRILAVGGNVRATVGLKLLPAEPDGDVGLHPKGGTRPLFAHLSLRAAPIGDDALEGSPTMRALTCGERRLPTQLVTANLVAPMAADC